MRKIISINYNWILGRKIHFTTKGDTLSTIDNRYETYLSLSCLIMILIQFMVHGIYYYHRQ